MIAAAMMILRIVDSLDYGENTTVSAAAKMMVSDSENAPMASWCNHVERLTSATRTKT